jgi:hypothetical protein
VIAATPDPPYLAVIFSSQRTRGDLGYAAFRLRLCRVEREYGMERP